MGVAPTARAASLDPVSRSLLPAFLTPDDGDAHDGRRLPRTTRDWIVDVACFLLAVGFGALTFFGEYPAGPAGDALAWADFLLASVACCALWVRRRWPVGLALTLVPLGFFSTGASGALVIALFTVAVHRRFSTVAILALLQMVTVFVYVEIHPDQELPYWGSVLLVEVILVAVVAWGMFVRARRQLVVSLRDRALRAETEQQLRVAQARETERARIAREMHDVLAHRISLLSMHAGALEFRPDAPPEEVARAAGVIRASAHQALEDLREVIGVLRESGEEAPDDGGEDAPISATRPQPTLTDLAGLLDESRAAGMRIREEITVFNPAFVPGSVGRTAYRVVQEGLTNARKHAWGTTVDVRVTGGHAAGVTVEVLTPAPMGVTDGVGALKIPGGGTGLIGLAERTTLAGGRLEHGQTADGGFRLQAWLPWSS